MLPDFSIFFTMSLGMFICLVEDEISPYITNGQINILIVF